MNMHPLDPETATATETLFLTGYGQSDTHALTLSDGRPNPHRAAGTPYGGISGRELVALIRDPQTCAKDAAQWIIPSIYRDMDGRSHEVQRERGAFCFLPLDIDGNNMDLSDVLAFVWGVTGQCATLAYSTASATADNRKWRVMVPLQTPVAGADYADTMGAFNNSLETASAGVLIPDRALERPGQLIYLPNKRGEFYEFHIGKGARLALTADHPIIERRDATRAALNQATEAAQAARARRLAARPIGNAVTPVDAFNAAHGVADLLARYGYKQAGQSNDWRSPYQTGGSFATRDFGDYWISLSDSDAAAKIGKATPSGRYGDAFDLKCYFEHGGDFTKACAAYADELELGRKPAPGQAGMDDIPSPPLEAYANEFVEGPGSARTSRFYSAATLKGKPVPPREWVVQDLIPRNTVTLYSGDGGAGKSLTALQLVVAVVALCAWMGRSVAHGKAIYLTAEDDNDELHRRLDDILRATGRGYDDIAGLTLRSLAGEDALLAVETQIAMIQSALFKELDQRAADDAPALIVIDTLADVYPSNENDRAKVRQFVCILRGLALRHKCAVLLLGHPSLTGLSSGSGSSGSTAWNNSVRSRLYLSRIVQDGYEPDPDKRVLTTKKANYGRIGDEIAMTWRDGVFVPDEQPQGLDRMAMGARAERVFLKLLRRFAEEGRTVNHTSGQNFAPKVFSDHPDSEGVQKAALKTAMNTLLAKNSIRIATGGKPSRPVSYLKEVLQ